jgi:phosphoglycerate dehydrogenase-like enzyme
VSGSRIEVLVIVPLADEALKRIASVDARLDVVDARGLFDLEIRETWPSWSVQRYLGERPVAISSREKRDRMLAHAEVILGGWPFPLDLRSRSHRLRWFHQLPAGASNLIRGDLWESDVIVTTSRGYGNTLAMAEYVVACFFHFARGLQFADLERQNHRFDHRDYRPIVLQRKTVCVVGAGGIGREVGQLCAAAGMRVVGTRRRQLPSAALPPGFIRIEAADRLHELLSEADCVAICCQWTPETTRLIGREALGAMKPEAILVNVARGEIIDEAALSMLSTPANCEALRWTFMRGNSNANLIDGSGTTSASSSLPMSQPGAMPHNIGASNSFAKTCARI